MCVNRVLEKAILRKTLEKVIFRKIMRVKGVRHKQLDIRTTVEHNVFWELYAHQCANRLQWHAVSVELILSKRVNSSHGFCIKKAFR